jgi:hypothetical protein
MDLVYPLGTGSYWNNNELRFSLRSVEKYLTNVDKVWIIGILPDWLQNVTHITYTDHVGKPPDYNMMKKLARACQEDVSDDFIYMNDDHYLLSAYNANNFPNYYHGTIEEYLKGRGLDGYGKRCRNTLKSLNGNSTNYYDIHYPIQLNKKSFKELVVDAVDWNVPHAYIIKSLYANSLQLESIPETDYKTNVIPPPEAKVFSSFPHMKDAVKVYLNQRFPEQSKYERVGL